MGFVQASCACKILTPQKKENNINTLDTARIYGKAEEVIGSFKNRSAFQIISKFKLSNSALDNFELAVSEAKNSIAVSKEKLKVNDIPVFLFHKDKHQDMHKVADTLSRIFKILKKEDIIKEGGISVYSPMELKAIQQWKDITVVQAPMNVLDSRLLHDNLINTLIRHDVKLFIRSIFLQGLIFMKAEELPAHMEFTRPYLKQVNDIALEAERSIQELAFCFVRDSPGVTSIVVGADTIEQLKENIHLLESSPLPDLIYDKIKKISRSVPEEVITPALWNHKL